MLASVRVTATSSGAPAKTTSPPIQGVNATGTGRSSATPSQRDHAHLRPNTSAPNGRTKNPTPNSARLESNASVSLPGGKNSRPKVEASVP